MAITLKQIIELAKQLPEDCYAEIFEKMNEAKEKAEANAEKESKTEKCPHCASKVIVRNGKKHKKQAYLCRNCGKSFVQTTCSAIENSHSSETVWRAVISDTVDGVSLEKTAESLNISPETAFNMRHKILFCVEQAILSEPVELEGVCEADETYVLESVKGEKIPENYHRKPRKHGSKANKAGLSDEYICVQTSVTGKGDCIAVAVNRATPSKTEITEVFGDLITDDTVILCDGNTKYDVLNEKCTVAHTERINKVNNFHSCIKERLRTYRGVSTVYLNRYNALFAKIFDSNSSPVDEIYKLMTLRGDSFFSIQNVKEENLLNI